MDLFSKYPNSTFLKSRRAARIQIAGGNARLSDLYSALEGLEEDDFEKKFDDDPHAMLWEMMVAKLLRESGLDLLPRKAKGPDFTAVLNGRTIAVEAVCPGLGDPDKPDSVPELKPTRDMRPIQTEKILLRIAGALVAKKQTFDRYCTDKIISRDTACIIAISSQKVGQAWGVTPCPGLTVTLGHGRPYAVFESGTNKTIREGFELKERLTKTNSSSVNTLPFLDDSYASISGLLYSDTSALGLPYDLIGDAHFFHNPRAAIPLARGTIRVGHEYCTSLHEDGGWSTEEITSGANSGIPAGD